MAVFFLCDGCGCKVSDPKKIGRVVPRDYCEDCAVQAAAFLVSEESLRVTARETFKAGRDALIAPFAARDFKLPDVP